MDEKLERRFYLHHFKAISHAISIYDDFNTLSNHLVEGTSRAFKAKGCSLMLLDERENQLFHVSSYGLSYEYIRKGPVLVKGEHCAVCTGEPVFIEDMQESPLAQYPQAAAREGIVSMLSIPIKCREAIVGVLRVYHGKRRAYHEDDIDSLCVLTSILGVVIENNGLRNFLDQVKIALGSLPLRMLKGL